MYCRKACSRTTLIPLIVAPLAMFLGRSNLFSPFKYSITQLVIGAANPFGASHAGSASYYIGMIIQLVVSERPVISFSRAGQCRSKLRTSLGYLQVVQWWVQEDPCGRFLSTLVVACLVTIAIGRTFLLRAPVASSGFVGWRTSKSGE